MQMSKFRRQSDEWPYHVSSGGVVIKHRDKVVEVALLFRRELKTQYDCHYHLPKGTLEDDETLEHCAVREVEEETGLKSRIMTYLGGVEDEFIRTDGLHYDKIIHFFLVEMTGGDIKNMDDEHDGVEWFAIDEAIEKLVGGVKHEDQIVIRARKWLQQNEG